MSTKEYEKLVGKELAAKVTGAGGTNCTLRHPDNRLINIEMRKDAFRLDPASAGRQIGFQFDLEGDTHVATISYSTRTATTASSPWRPSRISAGS